MSEFANQLIQWHKNQGRHDLPWQQLKQEKPNVYYIWLSEIMLQQTQVKTVIPYFENFIKRFPTLNALAEASIDDVLAHWSGLGYYARARNLHETAQRIVSEFNGEFPQTHSVICDLKGIGRSTASAICSFAFQQRHAILDGNVKRVLSRYLGIQQDIHSTETIHQLWEIAYQLLPEINVDIYIQAQMDLGATICTPKNPTCLICPVQKSCYAFINQCVTDLPIPKKSKQLPQKETIMYIFQNAEKHEILMNKRPNEGLWGGLYTFPEEINLNLDLNKFIIQNEFEINHTFTHFKLKIFVKVIMLNLIEFNIIQNKLLLEVFKIKDVETLGIPTPIRKIMKMILKN